MRRLWVEGSCTVVHPSGDRRTTLLGLANLAGLALVMRQGGLSQQTFESGLLEGLGKDYREELETRYTDLDWKTPVRDLAWPFGHRVEGVEVLKDIPYEPRHGRRGLLDVYRSFRRDAAVPDPEASE